MSRRWKIAILGTLLALAILFAASFRLRRRPIPHATSSVFRTYLADRGSRMVVYSPDLDAQATGDLIRKQLSLLRRKFDGLVLYECDGESDFILRSAESLGFRAVLLTIWSPTSNEEIQLAAKLVRTYGAHLALAVSIGSEGIMEKRYTVHDLEAARRDLLRSSDSGLEVETTTTEPWWLYMSATPDSRRLESFGEFLCVNIHAIWDTDLTSPATAAEWTADRARELARATGRPVLIREAGFPGGGYSPRRNSSFEFTRDLQLGFWENWNTRFRSSAPPIVAFEGIDNPAKHWKSFESTWGLLDPDLQPHPAWEAFPNL